MPMNDFKDDWISSSRKFGTKASAPKKFYIIWLRSHVWSEKELVDLVSLNILSVKANVRIIRGMLSQGTLTEGEVIQAESIKNIGLKLTQLKLIK
jgi:hypothetical protein